MIQENVSICTSSTKSTTLAHVRFIIIIIVVVVVVVVVIVVIIIVVVFLMLSLEFMEKVVLNTFHAFIVFYLC